MDASPASLPLSFFTGSAAGCASTLARTTRPSRCCRCCCAGLKACRAVPRQNVLHAACIWWPCSTPQQKAARRLSQATTALPTVGSQNLLESDWRLRGAVAPPEPQRSCMLTLGQHDLARTQSARRRHLALLAPARGPRPWADSRQGSALQALVTWLPRLSISRLLDRRLQYYVPVSNAGDRGCLHRRCVLLRLEERW